MCIVIQSTCVEAAAVAAATLRTQRTHSDFELYDCHYVTTRYSTVSRYLDFPWDLQRPPPVSVVPGVMMNFYPFVKTGNRGSPGPRAPGYFHLLWGRVAVIVVKLLCRLRDAQGVFTVSRCKESLLSHPKNMHRERRQGAPRPAICCNVAGLAAARTAAWAAAAYVR